MNLDDLLNVARGLCEPSTESQATTKAMPGGEADSGIHLHTLERERDRTQLDGAHRHVFVLDHDLEIAGTLVPAGSVLMTEEDGVHDHEIGLFAEGPMESESASDGAHRHRIVVAGVDMTTVFDVPREGHDHVMPYCANGRHTHQLQRSHTCFDGTHQHMLMLPDGSMLWSLTGNQMWQHEGAPNQAGTPPAPPASTIAAEKSVGVVRALERDTTEKDHRCAFCVTKADHAVITHGGRAFVPACSGHVAKARGEVRKTSEVVAVRRLVKRRPFELKKSGEVHGQLPALKVYDPRSIVTRLAQGLPVGLLSVRKRQERVGKQQALVNEISVMDHPYVWGVVRQEEPIELGSIDELSEDLRDGIAEAVVKSFAEEERIFYLPLALDIAFEAPVPLRKVPEGRRFARHVDFDRDVQKVDGRQLTMDDLFNQAVTKGVDELLNHTHDVDLTILSNNQLDALVNQLHAVFGRVEERGFTKQQVVEGGVAVFSEYIRRDREYPKSDDLSEAVRSAIRSEIETPPEDDGVAKGDLLAVLAKTTVADGAMPSVYLVGDAAPFDVVVCGAVDDELFATIETVVVQSLDQPIRKSLTFRRADAPPKDAVKLFDVSLQANQTGVAKLTEPPSDLLNWCTLVRGRVCDATVSVDFTKRVPVARLSLVDGDHVMHWAISLGKNEVSVASKDEANAIAKMFSVDGGDHFRALRSPSRTYAIPTIGEVAKAGIVGDVDLGRTYAEIGVHTSNTIELFLSGGIAGRLVFKRLVTESGPWVVRMEDPLPLVLTKGGAPPGLDGSNLPCTVEAMLDHDLRWWNADSREEAIKVHDRVLKSGLSVELADGWWRLCKSTPLPQKVEALGEDDIPINEVVKRDVRLIRESQRIQKATDGSDERFVFGVVLVPEDVDSQGDIYDQATVRNAAHSFLERFGGTMKLMHQGRPVTGLVVLESYVSRAEETHGEETFPIGTWFLAVRVRDDGLWEAIKRGDFTGFSIGGTAMREPLAQGT